MISVDRQLLKNLTLPDVCSLCLADTKVTKSSFLETRAHNLKFVPEFALFVALLFIFNELARSGTPAVLRWLALAIAVGIYIFAAGLVSSLADSALVSSGLVLRLDVPLCESHRRAYARVERLDSIVSVVFLLAAGASFLVPDGSGQDLRGPAIGFVIMMSIAYFLYVRPRLVRRRHPLTLFSRRWFSGTVDLGFANTRYEERVDVPSLEAQRAQ